MTKKPIILGIESSCDETAAAVIQENNGNPEILSNIVEYQKSDHTRNHGDKSIAEQMDEEDELYGKDNPYKDLDDEALSEELYHLENYIVLDYLATKPADNENKMKHGQLLWLLK